MLSVLEVVVTIVGSGIIGAVIGLILSFVIPFLKSWRGFVVYMGMFIGIIIGYLSVY